MYIIKDPKKTIKRHHNQIGKRYSGDINNQKEEPMKTIHDLFDVPMAFVGPEERRLSKRKRTFSGIMKINPKRKIQLPKEVVNSKKGDVMVIYISRRTKLCTVFSPESDTSYFTCVDLISCHNRILKGTTNSSRTRPYNKEGFDIK